ncbi:MAG: RNA-binding cell elongation regulator Jag/EloR [Thermodesulfobacteriota bacterium]
MRFVEVEGKSKDDATQKAARELGVPVDEIGIEILSDSGRGFFGFVGGKKVKIRAWSKRESREELHDEVLEIRQAVADEPVPAAFEDEEETEKTEKVDKTEQTDKARKAQEVLQGLIGWLSEQATVEIKEETSERILLEIHGDKTGLLIGKRGQTLDALQFLANKMVNRSRDSAKRIEVDMEQYRKRREQSLRTMAVRLGQKVKKKRKPITIEAMNAHDRRIVHLTLKNDRALETKSVGKGEMRKLVIHPVNGGRSKRYEGSGAAS